MNPVDVNVSVPGCLSTLVTYPGLPHFLPGDSREEFQPLCGTELDKREKMDGWRHALRITD